MKRKREKSADVVRVIDGAAMQLHLWLVLERSATGVPLKMMITHSDETMEQCIERAGGMDAIYKSDDGKPLFELMWTPQRYLRPRD